MNRFCARHTQLVEGSANPRRQGDAPSRQLVAATGVDPQKIFAGARLAGGRLAYFEFRKHPRSITYWFIYGFNVGDPAGFTNHEGDWERISVQLDDNNHARKVAYYQHDGSCVLDWNAAPKTRAGHPIVYSDNGSHASSPTGTDGGPRWGTWKHLRNVLQTPWYGYGGAWGSASDTSITTGPLGPSPYKLGPSQGLDQAGC